MATVDLAIVLFYVIGLFTFGLYVGSRESSEDFLILSRRAGYYLVLFSIVSTWVGVGMFVGTTAEGYRTGISFGLTGAIGALVAVIAAGLFAPRIKAFGDEFRAHTLGDFFRVRYSSRSAKLAGMIIALVYLLFTAVQFTGLSDLLRVWAGLGAETAVIVTAVSTIIYTAYSGIKSDFYTDGIHFSVMVLVIFGVLLPSVGSRTDGFEALRSLPKGHFDLFAYGGPGYFFGGLIIGVGIVFVSMELWQRIYASASQRTARWALVSSAVIVVPFYLAAMFLGLSARVLYPSVPDQDLTLFMLMRDILPKGLLGLGMAAFIAIFVSTVNTMLMVVSATVTKDFLGDRLKGAAEKKVLRVARVTTLMVGILGMGVSYIVNDVVTLSVLALFSLLVLLPAVIGGFFWRRATNAAAFWSVLLGFIVTGAAVPFMPETAFVPGFLVSCVVFVAMSFLTTHSPSETPLSSIARKDVPSVSQLPY